MHKCHQSLGFWKYDEATPCLLNSDIGLSFPSRVCRVGVTRLAHITVGRDRLKVFCNKENAINHHHSGLLRITTKSDMKLHCFDLDGCFKQLCTVQHYTAVDNVLDSHSTHGNQRPPRCINVSNWPGAHPVASLKTRQQ